MFISRLFFASLFLATILAACGQNKIEESTKGDIEKEKRDTSNFDSIKDPPWIRGRSPISVKVFVGKDSLTLNGKKVPYNEFEKRLDQIFSDIIPAQMQSKIVVVILGNDRDVSYEDQYKPVYDVIEATYRKYQNVEALRRFSKGYEELDDKQKKEVASDIPFLISEMEPEF